LEVKVDQRIEVKLKAAEVKKSKRIKVVIHKTSSK
jgi:hypothetical protein